MDFGVVHTRWEHSYKLVIPVSRTHYTLQPSEELEKSTTSSSISCSIITVNNTLCTNKAQRPPRALGPPGFNRQTWAHAPVYNIVVNTPTPSSSRHRSRHLNNLVDDVCSILKKRTGALDSAGLYRRLFKAKLDSSLPVGFGN